MAGIIMEMCIRDSVLTMSEIGMAGLRFGKKNQVPIISTVHEFHNAQQLDGEQSLQQIFSLIMPVSYTHLDVYKRQSF